MKFLKGILIGAAITTLYMMCSESEMINKKNMMKQGKRWAKKMGIM